MAFVVLVAVGADYNMLLVSRMRDESPRSMRYGIIRTLSSTGGVITAAGLIFAASMGGLLFSSIGIVVQGGFVIGVGILLDTFVVRTITVPAIATLVGRANWWPSELTRAPRRSRHRGSRAAGLARTVMYVKLRQRNRAVRSADEETPRGTCGAGNCRRHRMFRRRDRRPPTTPAGRPCAGAAGDAPPPMRPPGTAYALGGAHVLGIPVRRVHPPHGRRLVPRSERGRSSTIPRARSRATSWSGCSPVSAGIGDRSSPARSRRPQHRRVGRRRRAEPDQRDPRRAVPGSRSGCPRARSVLNAVKARLANDPTAPPPDQLSFATFGDPVGKHAFGESFLTQNVPRRQRRARRWTTACPRRWRASTTPTSSSPPTTASPTGRIGRTTGCRSPTRSSGLATGHTAVAFTNPSMVPPQNIRTTVNSRGATTTTYMIPEQHLPLVLPFKYLGVDRGHAESSSTRCCKPMVNAGYSRNDDPATAPITGGSGARLRPGGRSPRRPTQAAFGGAADPVSQILSGYLSASSSG